MDRGKILSAQPYFEWREPANLQLRLRCAALEDASLSPYQRLLRELGAAGVFLIMMLGGIDVPGELPLALVLCLGYSYLFWRVLQVVRLVESKVCVTDQALTLGIPGFRRATAAWSFPEIADCSIVTVPIRDATNPVLVLSLKTGQTRYVAIASHISVDTLRTILSQHGVSCA